MLKVNEIFYSIQGESSFSGYPCIFIRLTGCNLRCIYCDTQYAYEEGRDMTIDAILHQIDRYSCAYVEITGGEPLLQNETSELAEILIRKGYQVLIETNGSQNIGILPDKAIKIMDIKCPGSGEANTTDWNNLDHLTQRDDIKFVISNEIDYDWAKNIVFQYQLMKRSTILFSPAHKLLNSTRLANWILYDNLNVKLHLQLHKIIWSNLRRK